MTEKKEPVTETTIVHPSTSATTTVIESDANTNVRTQDSVSPDTTLQADLTLAGQRKINLIWEYTQSILSIIVVIASVAVAVFHGMTKDHDEFPQTLSNTLFLIVGFYFSRTNHAAIGGTGDKPFSMYRGR